MGGGGGIEGGCGGVIGGRGGSIAVVTMVLIIAEESSMALVHSIVAISLREWARVGSTMTSVSSSSSSFPISTAAAAAAEHARSLSTSYLCG